MSTASIVVMLVWAGTGHGGPAVIPGFATLAACERAKAEVVEFYADNDGAIGRPAAACKAFAAGGGGAP